MIEEVFREADIETLSDTDLQFGRCEADIQ